MYPNEPEEPDLDYGDLGLESDEPAEVELLEVKLKFTDKMPPGSGLTDWEPIRKSLVAHRLAKGRSADGSKQARKAMEPDEVDVEVTELGHEIAFSELNQPTAALAKRVLACKNCPHPPERHLEGVCNVRGCECAGYVNSGWQIKAQRSGTHNSATLFQDDSKTNDDGEEGHSRGDVRFPAEDRVHHSLAGMLMNGKDIFAAFNVVYEARPKDGSLTSKFASAHFWDEISGNAFTNKATVFGDWFDIFIPPAEARAPRKTLEEKRDEKLAAPMATGEWSG